MEQFALIGIAQLVLAGLMAAVASAVRFAGASQPLNIVDYSRVDDPPALHRWAGNRLFLVPVVFAASGLFSMQRPSWALPLLFCSLIVCLGVLVWLAVGVARFHHGR